MNYWILLASPDKWFGEREENNYMVNDTLLNLDEYSWRVDKRYFTDASIGDHFIIKIGKDNRSMKRRTSPNGNVVDTLESGIYGIGKICSSLYFDKEDKNYKINIKISNNLYSKNSIINSETAEKVLGNDYSSMYSKKIERNKYNNIISFINISDDIDYDKVEGEESLEPNSIDAENPLYPAEVKIQRDTFSVRELKTDYEEGILILAPDFQREFVWKLKEKSELIESILMGIPLPMIYFFEDDDGVLQVVDGKQRLTSLFQFMDDEFPLSHTLSILRHLIGKRYSELTPSERTKIARHQFITHTIIPPTPDKIKFDIFERVNRKGSTLNNQEMRNALYQGKSTDLLNSLSECKYFLNSTDNGISPTRMKDKYMILRFLSFYLWKEKLLKDKQGNFVEYASNIDDFVGKTMYFLNKQNDTFIKDLTTMFKETMKLAYELRKKDAFRIPSNVRKRPINMALMESLGYLFSKLIKLEDYSKYITPINNLLEDKEFIDSLTIRIDNTTSVQKRFKKIDEIIEDFTNDR